MFKYRLILYDYIYENTEYKILKPLYYLYLSEGTLSVYMRVDTTRKSYPLHNIYVSHALYPP